MDYNSRPTIYKIDTNKVDSEKLYTIKTYLHKLYEFAIYVDSKWEMKMSKPAYYRAEKEDNLKNVPVNMFSELQETSKLITQFKNILQRSHYST